MKLSKFVAIFVVGCIIISSFPVYAEDTATNTENTELSYGITSVPQGYIGISTKEQLADINNDLSGKYILMSDIVFTDEDFAEGGEFCNDKQGWQPIGTEDNPFTGVFNGNGYTISNLWVGKDVTKTEYLGIFGTIKNAQICNVNLSACEIQGYDVSDDGINIFMGSLVGACYNSKINNISVYGGVVKQGYVNTKEQVEYQGYGAGIVCYASESVISNCVNYSEIDGEYAAGIVYNLDCSTMNNCINYGPCFAENYAKVVGIVNDNSQISNCCYMNIGGVNALDKDVAGVKNITNNYKDRTSYSGFDFDNTWNLGSDGIMKLKFTPEFSYDYIDSIMAYDVTVKVGTSSGVHTESGVSSTFYILGIKVEVEDTNIAKVDTYGQIVGVNVGTTKVKVTDVISGISTTCNVTVEARDIAVARIDAVYRVQSVATGTKKVEVSTYVDGKKISSNDYSATVVEEVKNKTVSVTVYGKGNYTGQVTKTFDMSAKNISGVGATGYTGVYDGKAHTVSVTGVPTGAIVLYSAGTDKNYTTTKPRYTNKVDTKVCYIVRKEGYNDAYGVVNVKINPLSITKTNAKLAYTSALCTGSLLQPKMTIYNNGALLRENYDYKYVTKGGTYPGTASVKVQGINNYTGYLSKNFTIKLPKSAVPAKTSVALYGYDDIKISWSKVSGACRYDIYYKSSKMSSYKKLGSTTKLYYNKANLADGLKYTFRIYPCKKIGTKVFRMNEYKTTSSIYTLKKVSTPKVVKYSSGKAKVSWTNINGETGYQISRSTSKTKTNIVATYKTTTGNYRVVKATRNRTYYYKVRAYKVVKGKKIYGPWSNVRSYKVR